MKSFPVFRSLSDARLAGEVERLAQRERDSAVEIIAALEEFDRRQLFYPAGYRSLFMYCRDHLRMGEGAAYTRIEAARAYRRFPVVLSRLADGSITLATIGLIGRHLTTANHLSLLDRCRHQPKREVERIVAGLQPRPDAPTIIRRAPSPPAMDATGARATAPLAAVATPTSVHALALSALQPEAQPKAAAAPTAPVEAKPAYPVRPAITPLTYERFKLQITIDGETHALLREVQDLARHAVPSGDAAIIVSRALRLMRDDLLRKKAAQVARPRVEERDVPARSTRHIPAHVRRAVWTRDAGQCAFVGSHGRCTERGFLEYHHVRPYADGGLTDAQNIELRCQGHNNFEARQFFDETAATAT